MKRTNLYQVEQPLSMMKLREIFDFLKELIDEGVDGESLIELAIIPSPFSGLENIQKISIKEVVKDE